MNPQYALAGHVFACLDGDHVVLLDLKEDRYLALKAADTRGLDSHVGGWPLAGGMDERVAKMLLNKGLLTADAAPARRPNSRAAINASREVYCDYYEDNLRRPAGCVLAFVVATAVATVAIRFWSFERVVRHVRKRNATQSVKERSFDSERLRQLISIFSDLRPFLFGWRDACLFESFVLSEFLARHEIFPTWMFGVQARPFGAHCWLQLGDTVLNDTVERVSVYTPIMAV